MDHTTYLVVLYHVTQNTILRNTHVDTKNACLLPPIKKNFYEDYEESLLTFVKTPLYYYVLSRKEEATKVLKRKRQKPSFKASSRQRSTRYNAYCGSRRAILLEADGW